VNYGPGSRSTASCRLGDDQVAVVFIPLKSKNRTKFNCLFYAL
jgi:hypothetical protein